MRGGGVESLPRDSVAIFAQDRGWGKRGRLLIDIDINKQEKKCGGRAKSTKKKKFKFNYWTIRRQLEVEAVHDFVFILVCSGGRLLAGGGEWM